MRLGRVIEGLRGPRPLLVNMRDAKEKFEMLKNARNIKRAKEERVRRVIIAPDLTKKERETKIIEDAINAKER